MRRSIVGAHRGIMGGVALRKNGANAVPRGVRPRRCDSTRAPAPNKEPQRQPQHSAFAKETHPFRELLTRYTDRFHWTAGAHRQLKPAAMPAQRKAVRFA